MKKLLASISDETRRKLKPVGTGIMNHVEKTTYIFVDNYPTFCQQLVLLTIN